MFRKLKDLDNKEREQKRRILIKSFCLDGTPHETLAIHKHLAYPASMKPTSLEDIAQKVKSKVKDL